MTGDGMTAEQQCFAQYGLDDRILQTLELLGMEQPTAVQREVIPKVLQK